MRTTEEMIMEAKRLNAKIFYSGNIEVKSLADIEIEAKDLLKMCLETVKFEEELKVKEANSIRMSAFAENLFGFIRDNLTKSFPSMSSTSADIMPFIDDIPLQTFDELKEG